MRRHRLLPVILALTCFTHVSLAQSAHDLFQQALVKERSDGDLKAAIALYEEVVSISTDRFLSARALVQIGKSYEKLGLEEAVSAYQRVIVDFADQEDLVVEARRRMADLVSKTPDEAEPEKMAGMTVAKVADVDDDMGMVSPDGKWLSYVDWATGNVAIQDLETGEQKAITSDGTWGEISRYGDVSIWSPDSQQLLYLWMTNDEGELRIYDLRSGETRILVPRGAESTPFPRVWFPDGSKFLAINELRNHITDAITVVDVSDGSSRVVESLPDNMHTFKMSLSPDGRYIVYEYFVRSEEGGDRFVPRDLRIVRVDGSGSSMLIEHEANDSSPCWTQDGSHVLFWSDRMGKPAIWAIRMDGDQPVGTPFLVHSDISGEFKGLSDDGSYYYVLWIPGMNVFLQEVDLATGVVVDEPTILTTHFQGISRSGSFTRDGHKLLHIAEVYPIEGLFIREMLSDRVTRVEVPFSRLERQAHTTPVWSPDNESIAISGWGGNGWQLDVIDVATGDATTVVVLDEGRIAGRGFSPDGSVLYYATSSGYFAYSMTSGTTDRLGSDSDAVGVAMATSPDGKTLAALEQPPSPQMGARTIKLISTEDGSERTLISLEGERSLSRWVGLAWTPDSERLVYAENSIEPGQQLFVHHVSSGERIRLGEHVYGNDQRFAVQVHPDGNALVFHRRDSRFELWKISNLLADH